VVIHYEEALYQVYAPLPYSLLPKTLQQLHNVAKRLSHLVNSICLFVRAEMVDESLLKRFQQQLDWQEKWSSTGRQLHGELTRQFIDHYFLSVNCITVKKTVQYSKTINYSNTLHKTCASPGR